MRARQDCRSSVQLFAQEALGLLASPVWMRLRSELVGGGKVEEHLLAYLDGLWTSHFVATLQAFLAGTATGSRLSSDRLRRVCTNWVSLLPLASAEGLEPRMTAAELASLLTIRLHEALVQELQANPAGAGARVPPLPTGPSPSRSEAAGAEAGAALRRGSLAVTLEAVAVCWKGRRLPLSRTEARILAYLLERSFASWSQLHLLCGEAGEVNVATLRVFLHRLRSKLRRAGVATTLKTLRGQGVLLLMAAESPVEETRPLPRAA